MSHYCHHLILISWISSSPADADMLLICCSGPCLLPRKTHLSPSCSDPSSSPCLTQRSRGKCNCLLLPAGIDAARSPCLCYYTRPTVTRPALNMPCCPVQGRRGDPGNRGLHNPGVSSNHRSCAPNGRPWHRRSEPPAGDRNSITDHHVYVERHRSQDEVSIAYLLNASRHNPAELYLMTTDFSARDL